MTSYLRQSVQTMSMFELNEMISVLHRDCIGWRCLIVRNGRRLPLTISEESGSRLFRAMQEDGFSDSHIEDGAATYSLPPNVYARLLDAHDKQRVSAYDLIVPVALKGKPRGTRASSVNRRSVRRNRRSSW